MGVSAGLCSGSIEDFGYANKNGLSDQRVRYLLARGEVWGEDRGGNFSGLEPRQQKKEKAKEENRLDLIL